MFAHVLAVLLGLGSLTFYLAAFFYPEVHRRSDFLWGGLGLLYAVVLWFGSGQMTGLVLLGQVAVVALLLGLGWQTLTVRREKTPVYQQTPIVLTPEVVGGWAKSKLNELRIVPDENVRPVRLERRAIAGSAAPNARLDPRRRPAYDYEFVEDGVGTAEVQQGELFSTALIGAEPDLSQELDEAAEVAYAAPPSAEAEVVAVEAASEVVISEAVGLEEDFTESAGSEEVISEAAVAEEFVSEAAIAESSTAESSIAEKVNFAPDESELEPEFDSGFEDLEADVLRQNVGDGAIANEPKPVNETPWIDEVPVTASKPKALPTATSKKPNLLAMPIILAGWVKDVVVALTKPKPTKPVIEIPRRDASVSRPPVSDPTSAPMIDESIVRDPVVSPSAEGDSRYNDDLEADDWEDSNWAD